MNKEEQKIRRKIKHIVLVYMPYELIKFLLQEKLLQEFLKETVNYNYSIVLKTAKYYDVSYNEVLNSLKQAFQKRFKDSYIQGAFIFNSSSKGFGFWADKSSKYQIFLKCNT